MQKNDVIIDLNLDHLDYDKCFETTKKYINLIFSLVYRFNMTNSIIFEVNPKILIKSKEICKNITVAVIIQDKEQLEKIKDSFKNFQLFIYSFGINVDESTVKKLYL